MGMTSPLSGDSVRNIDHLAFGKAVHAWDMSVWEGLHILPHGPPFWGAKLLYLFAVLCCMDIRSFLLLLLFCTIGQSLHKAQL